MTVLISMLRGINVGGHAKIKMDALRTLYSSLKFENPQSYVQSGNVIFQTEERDLDKIAKRIQQAIEKQFACCPEIMLRSLDELRSVVKKNPFAKRSDVEPNKLLVSFLLADPGIQARKTLLGQKFAPEELHAVGKQLYIYFPNGVGKSKLPWRSIDKILHTPSTGRNWNSVTKMLEIAEKMEARGRIS